MDYVVCYVLFLIILYFVYDDIRTLKKFQENTGIDMWKFRKAFTICQISIIFTHLHLYALGHRVFAIAERYFSESHIKDNI